MKGMIGMGAMLAAVLMLAMIDILSKAQDTKLGTAYGCGMVAERKFFRPPEDPIDIPERPWCAKYRKLWESE
jgi:hypothetical protein